MIDSFFWKRVAGSWAKDGKETVTGSLTGNSSFGMTKSPRDSDPAGASAGGRVEEEGSSWFDMSGEEIDDMLAGLGLNDF
ncbi:MAG: hypothetical protein LIO86_00215 [Lachnospiraceae bacterium]|nr:hypothetical protein [Lachnospiraceae bacterium]